MRIGFNTRFLHAESLRGFNRYTYELARALTRINGVQLSLFSDRPLHPRFLQDIEADTRMVRACKHLWWEQIKLPHEIGQAYLDVFHQPAHLGLPWKKVCPYVVTNHGLTEYGVPHLLKRGSWKARLQYRISRSITLKSADKIIAVSYACKQDLMHFWKVPDDKVVVIYEAASERFRPITDYRVSKQIRAKYALQRDYILFVGGFDPRKNVGTLIEAYARCRARDKLDLVLIADKIFTYPHLVQRVQELGLEGKVHCLGQIIDDLPGLYGTARVFVFPSFHESFGLPVVEAMACGTPVIASNRFACPEIVGDGGLLCNPSCPDDIAEKIDAVCFDEALSASLRERALGRAAEFSWAKAAQETLAVYQEVIKAGKHA